MSREKRSTRAFNQMMYVIQRCANIPTINVFMFTLNMKTSPQNIAFIPDIFSTCIYCLWNLFSEKSVYLSRIAAWYDVITLFTTHYYKISFTDFPLFHSLVIWIFIGRCYNTSDFIGTWEYCGKNCRRSSISTIFNRDVVYFHI